MFTKPMASRESPAYRTKQSTQNPLWACRLRVYLPYLAETQDEKQYRVVMDRERWFSVVMGEKFKVDARNTEKLASRVPLPESVAENLAFRLSADHAPE